MNDTPVPTTENGAASTPAVNPFVQHITDRIVATGCYVGSFGILGQALTADTLEAAMNMGEMIDAEAHMNERIRFVRCSFADSDPALGARVPYFAVCEVMLDDGTGALRKMSIGAEHVLGVLIRACEQDWFPFEGQLQSVRLDSVRTAINLVPVPAKVTNTAKR